MFAGFGPAGAVSDQTTEGEPGMSTTVELVDREVVYWVDEPGGQSVDQLVGELRAAVLDGEFHPGDGAAIRVVEHDDQGDDDECGCDGESAALAAGCSVVATHKVTED